MGFASLQARGNAVPTQQAGCQGQENASGGLWWAIRRSYRLWDPAEPLKISNSAEVSFREKETRGVFSPKVGYDPLPEPGRITYQPGSAETHEEEKEDEEEKEENLGVELGPQTQQPDLRRRSRTPVPRQVLNLHTTEEPYERVEHSLLTGSKLGNIATSRPGEVGYMPSVPANYNEAMSGPDAGR